MKYLNHVLAAAGLTLAACSAKISGSSPAQPAVPGLTASQANLAGTVDGQAWKGSTGVAQLDGNGNYDITLAPDGSGLACGNPFVTGAQILFNVPQKTGTYSFDSQNLTGGTAVDVAFQNSGDGSTMNVIADRDQIQINSIANGVITGNLEALATTASSHSYNLSGNFQVTICGSSSVLNPPTPPSGPAPVQPAPPPQPTSSSMSITKNGASAFQVAFAEVVKLQNPVGSLTYELRMMDKIPDTPCEPSESWMYDELPVNYVTLQIPAQLGAFSIGVQTMDFGNQNDQGGIDMNGISGTGNIQSFTASSVTLSLNAADVIGAGIVIQGSVTAQVCQ